MRRSLSAAPKRGRQREVACARSARARRRPSPPSRAPRRASRARTCTRSARRAQHARDLGERVRAGASSRRPLEQSDVVEAVVAVGQLRVGSPSKATSSSGGTSKCSGGRAAQVEHAPVDPEIAVEVAHAATAASSSRLAARRLGPIEEAGREVRGSFRRVAAVPSSRAPSLRRIVDARLDVSPVRVRRRRAAGRRARLLARARAGAGAARAGRAGGGARVPGGGRRAPARRRSAGLARTAAARSSATSSAARGSPCTATTTSTASARPRSSCARCARSAPTSTGTCRAGSTTATASRAPRSSGSPRAGRSCWSPSTARSPRSRRSRPRAPLGMDVVVTDHHTPARRRRAARRADRAPAARRLPVPGPVRGRRRATSSRRRCWPARGEDPALADEDLDLVALATVADVVPLHGREPPPRARRACARSPARASPGLRALMDVARVDPSGARRGRDRLPPRPAAERRRAALPRRRGARAAAHRGPRARARAIAAELDAVNAERRDVETRIRFEAEALVAEHARARRALRARRRGLAPGRDRDRRRRGSPSATTARRS